MDFITKENDGILVVEPQGRIDSLTANELETELLTIVEQDKYRIVLDFGAIDFISSAGLRVLLVIAKKVKPHQGNVVLCNLNGDVMEVFDVSGFSTIFTIKPSVDDALESFNGGH